MGFLDTRTPRSATVRLALASLALATIAGACSSLRIGAVRPGEGDWPADGAGGERARVWAAPIGTSLEQAWRFDARAGFGPASPVVIDGRVLIGTRQGEVHVVELASGRRLGAEAFGDAIDAAPLFADDLLVIALEAGRRTLVGYDMRRGAARWRARRTPIRGTPLHLDDLVVGADARGAVFALEPETGAERWVHAPDGASAVVAAPARLAGGRARAAVAHTDGQVRAFDAGGRVAWEARVEPVYATPASAGGRLLVPTTRGRLHALDAATGRAHWATALGDSLVRITSPAVDADHVFVGTSAGDVVALDARTGRERWRTHLGEAVVAAPLLAQDVLFVGGTDRHLYALDRATGAVIECHGLDGRVKSGLAAVPGGVLVLAEPSYLYLYRAAGPTAGGG